MKKTLVAIAALAATSAFAQSSVEIYGIIDQSYASTTTKLSGDDGSITLKQTTTGNQSGSATQRIGFRGTEDLGNGLKGIFQIENSLTAGNAGTNGFGSRPTFVGLSDAQMGTLTLGRQDSPVLKAVVPQLAGGANNAVGQMNWTGFSIDPTNATAAAAAPAKAVGLARMAGHTAFVTNDSAINYKTATFSGFSGEVQYAKTGAKLDAGANGVNASSTSTGFNLLYANGPLTVNAATNTNKTAANLALTIADTAIDTQVAANAAAKYKTDYVGATYDLGMAKLSVTTLKDKYTTATDTVFANKGTSIGAQVPVTAKVSTWVSYGTGKRSFNNADEQFKQTSLQLGATYAFSKRTAAYGIYGTQKLAGDNVETTGVTFKQSQYVMGVRHSF